MPLEIVDVQFDCAGSQNLLGGRSARACRDCALVVVPHAFLDMVVTFRGRRKGKPRVLGLVVQRIPTSTFPDRCQGIGAALLRSVEFHGRCSTLHMVGDPRRAL